MTAIEHSVCVTVRDEPEPTLPAARNAWIAHRKRKLHKSGLCHTCWHDQNRAKKRHKRETAVKRRYEMSREEHDFLFRMQGGRCPHGRKITLLSPIDHDHRTTQVRGILCDPCNRFIGYVGDDPMAFLRLYVHLVRPIAQVLPVIDHAFETLPGLFQCTWAEVSTVAVRCGRLEFEHRFEG